MPGTVQFACQGNDSLAREGCDVCHYPQKKVKVGGCYMSELNVPYWCERHIIESFYHLLFASCSFVFSEVTFDALQCVFFFLEVLVVLLETSVSAL